MAAALSKMKNWFSRKSRSSRVLSLEPPPELLAGYLEYKKLLDANSAILAIAADLQARVNGGSAIDVQYVRQACGRLDRKAETLVAALLAMSGGRYTGREAARRQVARAAWQPIWPSALFSPRGLWPCPLWRCGKGCSSGARQKTWGELTRQGFKVPAGFGVSAYAQKLFFEAADLETYIRRAITQSHIRDLESLREAGEDIRARIVAQELPEELAQAISSQLAGLPSDRVAVRSSPLEEDGEFSFVGQFDTILNVTAAQVLERYKEVIASQFTPRSLYHCHTSGFSCQEAGHGGGGHGNGGGRGSRRLYTDDPRAGGAAVIHAARGLGSLAVEGVVAPDIYTVAEDRPVASHVGEKTRMHVPAPQGGLLDLEVPAERLGPCLAEDQVLALTALGREVRQHFQLPQDIEWALGADADFYLLQARPLREVCHLKSGGEGVHQSRAFQVLERSLRQITPLNLLDPRSADFRPEACRTYHDITRFAHAKAMEEMFRLSADQMAGDGARRPVSRLPLDLHLIDLGGGLSPAAAGLLQVRPEHLRSRPLLAYWKGVSEVGRQGPKPADLAGSLSGRTGAATDAKVQENLRENNFAIITCDYLNLSNRLGFHFATLESFLGTAANSYISFTFSGGGADLTRRRRRLRFLAGVLKHLHFRVELEEDAITARADALEPEALEGKLEILGRLMMVSKVVDMEILDDEAADRCCQEFVTGASLRRAEKPLSTS